MKKIYKLFILFLLSSFFARAQNVSNYLNPICDNEDLNTTAPVDTGLTNVRTSCSPFSPLTGYIDFYQILIQSGTTFTFIVTPNSNVDYDFAAWKNPNLTNLGPAERGSQNDPTSTGIYTIGLTLTATDLCEAGGVAGYPEPGKVKYFSVVPGDVIVIAINRWSDTDSGYSISFGGDATLDCSIVGSEYDQCDTDNNGSEIFDLDAIKTEILLDYVGNQVKMYDSQANAISNGTTGLISSNTYVVNNSNTETSLYARVQNSSGVLIKIIQIKLKSLELPNPITPTPLEACSSNGSLLAYFDLSVAGSEVLGLNDFNISFYTTASGAENATASDLITSPLNYQSGSATIYLRIIGPNGCATIRPLQLIVTPLDIETQNLTPTFSCDTDNNGLSTYDLTSYLPTLLNGSTTTYDIKYYTNQSDAQAGNSTTIADPTQFNVNNNTPTTIYVRLSYGNCFVISTILLNSYAVPSLTTLSQDICDENLDGIVNYSYSDLITELSAGQPTGTTITLHSSQINADNNVALTASEFNALNLITNSSIWVKLTNSNGCFKTFEYQFILGANVPVNSSIPNILGCIDYTGSTILDLSSVNAQISTETGLTYAYYLTLNDAQQQVSAITNFTTYTVTDPNFNYYVRVSKVGFCDSIVHITTSYTQITDQPQTLPLASFCDDNNSGNEVIDLTQYESQLVVTPSDYTFSFYTTQAAAENGGTTNQISSPTNYTLANGTQITIYVRIAKGNCYIVSQINLIAYATPTLSSTLNYAACDNDFNGGLDLNYDDLISYINSNQTAANLIEVFATEADATSGNVISESNFNQMIISGGMTLWIKVSNNNGCFKLKPITFTESQRVPVNANQDPIKYCVVNENEGIIDLAQLESAVTNISGATFTYYFNETNAQTQNNPISNSSNYPVHTNTGTVFVRVSAPGYCDNIVPITYKLYIIPIIDLETQYTLCPTESLVLDAGTDFPSSSYVWTFQNQTFTGNQITITQIGTYILEITGNNDCVSSKIITVTNPNPPTITHLDISGNTLTVSASAGENGVLEYSIDGSIWQQSNVFTNLIEGRNYTIYVREDQCLTDQTNVSILLIPNFFSPNGDGYNDTWEIKGLSMYTEGSLKIFDRFGKTLYQTNDISNFNWDGKYGGRVIASQDYWYILELQATDLTKELKISGHVTIKNN